jgi:hypothetical protein
MIDKLEDIKMKVIISANLLGIYKKPDFKDKNSDKVMKGKYILQLISQRQMEDGSMKSEMYDVSIPDEKLSQYRGKEGKDVQVECGYFTTENVPVKFYGI